jgi:hypothetical protein
MADAVYAPQDKGLIQAYADLHKDLDVPAGIALSPEHAGVVSRMSWRLRDLTVFGATNGRSTGWT